MKLRETTVYALGHDIGLRSAGKLRFLSNGPYSRHEVTTDFLAAIFARISAIRARNGVNRTRKRGAITRNTVEIPRVLARSRAHFHTGLNIHILDVYRTLYCRLLSKACIFGVIVNILSPHKMSPWTFCTSEYCPPGHYSQVNYVPLGQNSPVTNVLLREYPLIISVGASVAICQWCY